MKVANKILISIFLVTIITISSLEMLYYSMFKKYLESSYYQRYNSLTTFIANSFSEMDKLSDEINQNAVQSLRLIQKYQTLPSDETLDKLARKFGIQGFYVIDKKGKFLRSSDLPTKFQKNSLFSYCKDYQNLLSGHMTKQVTPILPSYPDNVPAKFIMMPNYDSSLILEASYHLKYIEAILLKIINEDDNINSIGLYSPNNYVLGFMQKDGRFEQGKIIQPQDKLFNEEKVFTYQIPAHTEYCCECTVKNTQFIGGKYFYTLILKVSKRPLTSEIYNLQVKSILMLMILILFAFFVSQCISKKITKRLGFINDEMKNIIRTGKLSTNLLSEIKSNDEIKSLAVSFEHMIKQLDEYQKSTHDKAIADVISKVVHNIRSPLLVLDGITAKLNNSLSEPNINLLKSAVKDIKTLSEKLLLIYQNKSKNDLISIDENDQIRYVTLTSMIKDIISLKNIEWLVDKVEISFETNQNCIFSWIKVTPIEFRSVLSNILNNSYEALDKKFKIIKVSLYEDNCNYIITVFDNGCGIPEDEILNVESGKSLKHAGSGLGLSSSIKYIEGVLNGRLKIKSQHHYNTTVQIAVPKSNYPSWFTNKINIKPSSEIVVVDDDISILDYWKHKLTQLCIKCKMFDNADKFIDYIAENKDRKNIIFIIDYELSHQTINGLSLIRNNLSPDSTIYLITTYAEEYWIQAEIESLPIYMIPKSHIFDITINVL